LIDGLGGMNHVTTAEKVLVELVGRDLYLLDEVDQRIMAAIESFVAVNSEHLSPPPV